MKLEWPMLTSTEPCDELRPTVITLWRMANSRSLPSRRAKAGGRIGAETGMGLRGADFRASRARAPVSSSKSAIFYSENTPGTAAVSVGTASRRMGRAAANTRAGAPGVGARCWDVTISAALLRGSRSPALCLEGSLQKRNFSLLLILLISCDSDLNIKMKLKSIGLF